MSAETHGLQVRAYRDLDNLQTLVPAWEELLSAYPLATTFCTLATLSLERHRVVGPVSLIKLHLMGDGSGDSDSLDMLVRPGWEERFAGALLHYLEEQKRIWDFCELNTLPPESPAAGSLLRYLQKQEWTALQHQRVASAIPLPDNWETYLQQLSSEDQKNLGRYTRRLEKRYQTRMYRCTQESELPALLEALFQLHQARWQAAGEPGSFESEERRRFYYELSRLLLARGRLEVWVLELNGTIAAVQYAFRHGSTVFQLQEGFDSGTLGGSGRALRELSFRSAIQPRKFISSRCAPCQAGERMAAGAAPERRLGHAAQDQP